MVPSVLLHFKNGLQYAVTFQKWFPICGYILKMVSSMQLHFKTGCNMQIHIKNVSQYAVTFQKWFLVCSYISKMVSSMQLHFKNGSQYEVTFKKWVRIGD
jgi:hypothetical protein